MFSAFSDDVWQWAGKDRKVYWIAKEDEIKHHEDQLSGYDRFVKITEIKLPAGNRRRVGMAVGLQMPPESKPISTPQSVENPRRIPTGPSGPDHIFDLVLDGKPLFLVEWSRES